MKNLMKPTISIIVLFLLASNYQECIGQEASANTPVLPNTEPAFATMTFSGSGGGQPVLMQVPIMAAPAFAGTVGPSPYGGFTMNDDQNFSFLHDPSVRKDLEFVDEQYKEYKSLLNDYQKELQVLMPQFGKHQNDPEAMAELQRKMGEIHRGQKDAIRELLLPHQRDRYQQVSRQMKMNMVGAGEAFQHGFLAKELGITNGQRKDLKKIQQDYYKELAEKTEELKSAAKKKIMDTLSSKQKDQLSELVGEDFKRDPNDWKTQNPEFPKTQAEQKEND